ncbi:phage gp6-like head-tail connector protein [Enterococcus faecalis]|uniref:phage gp6-like head-tail connector protein n=1 Tax=Enterococcus faecalis TaxID=1351 RepID=UPI0024590BE5|nr:phage gp6-like head-tail connector protein [Enterococcus faecalis]MDH5045480.1 phage gp6-like head-tail connector protein [Enterococcus faecalis]MDV7775769.1 phage gp6-like head-tail connector protein [Enterococcus faecalis]
MESNLLDNLKKHIRLEEGMDVSMLSFYTDSAKRYVKKKIGYEQEYLEIMVTTIMFEHRLSSADLEEALLALEPIFALEVLTDEPSK